MKHALYLTAKDWDVLSVFIQNGIYGMECIADDEHLAVVESLLKKINQVLILADDFYIE